MIKPLETIDTASSAQIHFEGMRNDFLPSFGINFLKVLHLQFIKSPSIIALGYFQNQSELKGIIFGTTDTHETMKKALLRCSFKLLPYVIPRLLKEPRLIHKLWETVKYGRDFPSLIKAELLILAVDKTSHRQGIGSKLISALKEEFKSQHIANFRVATLSSNKAANAFYKQLGGNILGSFSIYGRKWLVYGYYL